MHLRRAAAALSFLSLLLLASAAHNITAILAKHPSLSTFNHYLTKTRLAAEINRRERVTLCAVDNAAMAAFLSGRLAPADVRRALSLHVILDYYDAEMLHSLRGGFTLVSTLFLDVGASDLVEIVDTGDEVGFAHADDQAAPTVMFVKSLVAVPYNLSVIQVSAVMRLPRSRHFMGPASIEPTSFT